MSDMQKVKGADGDTHQTKVKTSKDSPQFGRLLLVLITAVALIVVITFATEAYYTP